MLKIKTDKKIKSVSNPPNLCHPCSVFFSIILISMLSGQSSQAQKTITFPSKDGLTITADVYESDRKNPYIILCHQARSGRGEYKEIAPRLVKLGFNCLAIDQRSGGESNFVLNETANLAKQKGLPMDYLDAEQDILAAMDYVAGISKEKMLLFGSSYSASLVLKIANKDDRVKAVIAFSPGEYFGSALNVKKAIAGFDKPAYVASSASEAKFVIEMLSDVKSVQVKRFAPVSGGEHAAKSLFKTSKEHDQYWLTLFSFMEKIPK